MKSIIILGDGMADEPIEALGGKTSHAICRYPLYGVSWLHWVLPDK